MTPTPSPVEAPADVPTETPTLTQVIDGLAHARVLCVGDVMLDRFVTGRVERISPEAPIPILHEQRETLMPGAAGNVAANLVALGASVHFVSVIGDDEAGRILAAELSARLGERARLIVDPARETTVKTRYMAGGQQLLRADRETVRPVDGAVAEALLSAVAAGLDDCPVVVLSDYAKGVLSPAVLAPLIGQAAARDRLVVVDPKGRDFARYRGAGVLTPNAKELADADASAPATADDAVAAQAARVMTAAGVPALVVTRSERGLTAIRAPASEAAPAAETAATVAHFPTEAREVFDVSGAGDTVTATLAAALAGLAGLAGDGAQGPRLLAGGRLETAALLANIAGGIVVGKAGTAVVTAEELTATRARQHLGVRAGKVAALAHALEAVRAWQRSGLKVAFTNGVFDLLHPGHLSLIDQARASADRLVVAINGDASVKRLKGPTRPVQDETARAAVLASLQAVDLVLVFDEDTPLETIRTLGPDVLVKGADYTVETVVGADLVLADGGRVLLADLAAGHSTTATIARLKPGGGSDPGR